MGRVKELKGIRDDLESFAAKAELVRRAGTGRVHFDKDIYGMFGSVNEQDARNIARGITFALHSLDLNDDGPAPHLDYIIHLHVKAEGPVGFRSIFKYATEQCPVTPTVEEVREAIARLEAHGVIEVYDKEAVYVAWW